MGHLNDDTRDALKRISTATITLQLLKRGIRDTYMRGVAPLAAVSERMVGEAVTLRFIPMREDISTPAILADKQNPQRVAIDTIPEGAVLVIDARGVGDCAALGDILAERIKQRGGAGAVTDGLCCWPRRSRLPYRTHANRLRLAGWLRWCCGDSG